MWPEPFANVAGGDLQTSGVLTTAGRSVQEKRGRVKWCKLEPDAIARRLGLDASFGKFESGNLECVFEAVPRGRVVPEKRLFCRRLLSPFKQARTNLLAVPVMARPLPLRPTAQRPVVHPRMQVRV